MSRRPAARKGERPVERSGGGPVVHLCQCGKFGCFGLSWPAVTTERWFCRDCLPADYFTRRIWE